MNLTVKQLAGTVASVGVLIGATFAVDNRYVHADEFKKQVITIKQDIADLHKSRLEDEVFKIELTPVERRSDYEKALLDRYKRQIRELEQKKERDALR